ncbi:putative envelope-like protein [Trifolium pratense]|uniref:Putative envelope-like protein n=1 Tax=Trifolium pratense TaxID=57577 RepID=A0A2K3N8V9_TRIPR|nr:putative envelope-like protein [Trifolium pratense]
MYVLYPSLHCLVHANQGKYDLNSSANVNSAVDASTTVNSDCIDEYIKETVLETNVVPDVYIFVAPDTDVGKNDQDNPDQVDTTEQERIPVVVRTDNNSEPSVDKSVGDDPDVVIVNDIVVGDKSLDKTPSVNVAGRIRNRAAKNVTTTKSKNASVTEEKKKSLKRKVHPTSDSEFELETDIAASGGTSRKSVGRKKIPLHVPPTPLDNVAGLMKIVSDLGHYYYMLVKEFLINIVDNCDDPDSPEYRHDVAELEVTENEICRTITSNRLKHWPTKTKLSATQLTANIILDQHPNILVDADSPYRRTGTSIQKKTDTLTRKQMVDDLTESSRALEARKLKTMMIL